MTNNGDHGARLDRIRDKLELLRRLEAEHAVGAVIGAPAPLEPIGGLPGGVTEVFSLFERLEGTYFSFPRPAGITSPSAWREHLEQPETPLGRPLEIGFAQRDLHRLVGATGGDPISMDAEDGGVYHIEPDDFVWLYREPDAEVEITRFADDAVTFFDNHVLGDRYPFLVETVLGRRAVTHHVRKGRFKGQHTDTWMRLLVLAGLVPSAAPDDPGQRQPAAG